MKLKIILFGNVYQFKDVKEVLVKVNELCLGDVLVGVVVVSLQECVVVKQVLLEMMVVDICNNLVIVYEEDCVMCLIQDDVNEMVYNWIKNWSISELCEYVLSDEIFVDDIVFICKGLIFEVVVVVVKICFNVDLIYGGKKMLVIKKVNIIIGILGIFSCCLQLNDICDDVQSIVV